MQDMNNDPLRDYREKRDFKHTPEPSGEETALMESQMPGAISRFVIHKHRSRTLHYDLRLEVDGVLKSWAVPKGPSMDPKTKRLAVPTEDHPLAYLEFEGVIPKGEYGAGEVIVWDLGIYENRTERKGVPIPAAEGIKSGHLSFWLEGKKLQGGFALTRTATGAKGRWLFVKKADRMASQEDILVTRSESVLSGRDIQG